MQCVENGDEEDFVRIGTSIEHIEHDIAPLLRSNRPQQLADMSVVVRSPTTMPAGSLRGEADLPEYSYRHPSYPLFADPTDQPLVY